MPPKKDKQNKDNKKAPESNAKAKNKDRSPNAPQPLTDTDKEFYLLQIKDQEQRILSLQNECDKLEVKNRDYDVKFDQLNTDRDEIVAYWKHQVEQKTHEIAELNDQILTIQQAKDSEKIIYDGQIVQLEAESLETKEQLTSENMILSGKLASLDEFRVQKEDLMAKFVTIEKQIEEIRAIHRDLMYDLERKAVIDKDKLRKEMLLRVDVLSNEFRHMSSKQMAETTKKTIRENKMMNSILTKKSDKTIEILLENERVSLIDKDQSMKLKILEKNKRMLSKTNNENQKMIKIMMEKCQIQESKLIQLEKEQSSTNEADEKHKESEYKLKQIRNEVKTLEDTLKNCQLEINSYAGELDEEEKRKIEIEKILRNAYKSINFVFQVANCDSVEVAIEAREKMLHNILILMNSAAFVGVGVDQASLRQFFIRKTPLYSSLSASGSRKSISRDSAHPLATNCSRVVSGVRMKNFHELGLSYKNKPESLAYIKNVGILSPTTRLGQLKTVTKKTISSQTDRVCQPSRNKNMNCASQLNPVSLTSSHEIFLEAH